MPHDPARVRDTREWLAKALRDLESATALLATRPPLSDTAAFHCQQAVEKSWKAFLSRHGVPFRKTHDLREIGTQCVQLDASLMTLAWNAEELTTFAWIFRYPGEPEIPTEKEAHEILTTAREVYAAVLARLPEEFHP